MSRVIRERSNVRKLPVIILADAGGNMGANIGPGITKIQWLNRGVREFIAASRKLHPPYAIHFAGITFGNNAANLVLPLTNVADAEWADVDTGGPFPVGAALTVLDNTQAKRELFAPRDDRPLVILISNSEPNDEWTQPLNRLNSSRQAGRPHRLAAAIDSDADRQLLRAFVAPTIENPNLLGAVRNIGSETELAQPFQTALSQVRSPHRLDESNIHPDPKAGRTGPAGVVR